MRPITAQNGEPAGAMRCTPGRTCRLVPARVSRLVVAGWAARDTAAAREHIQELALLGVRPPRRLPTYYSLAPALVTTAAQIDCIGNASSGEVEFLLAWIDGEVWVGAGSDHTDRPLEAHSVTASKQACAKPVAADLWLLDDVLPHWDELRLDSHILEDGRTVPYQSGSVAALKPPLDLIADMTAALGPPGDGLLLFGGTIPAIGPIRPSARFAFSLHDPALRRTISHAYGIHHLPNED